MYVTHFIQYCNNADVAQWAEHFIGNEEVGGSTPLVSSKELSPNLAI